MIIYPASAEKACPVAGCGCAERAPRYPSDMTDAEWEVLGPQARAVMAELRHGPGGRPMAHRLRVVVDAIRYLVRYGVEWRALPADFPPWQAVYAFFDGGLPGVCPSRWSTGCVGSCGWALAAPSGRPPR